MSRFDVKFGGPRGPEIVPHYCRDWDESGGCHGTNPDHGMSFEEARAEIVAYLEREAQEWREKAFDEWRREQGYAADETTQPDAGRATSRNLFALFLADGSLIAVRSNKGDLEDLATIELKLLGDEYTIKALVGVPEQIACRLEVQGTSEQWYVNGRSAALAAQPYAGVEQL